MSQERLPKTGTHDLSTGDVSWMTSHHLLKGASRLRIQADLYGVTTGDNDVVINIYESLTDEGFDASNISPIAVITIVGGTGTPAQQVYTKDLSIISTCVVIEVATSAGSLPAATLIVTLMSV